MENILGQLVIFVSVVFGFLLASITAILVVRYASGSNRQDTALASFLSTLLGKQSDKS